MNCCQCLGLELETKTWAVEDLDLYRRGKPVETTVMLIRALRDAGVEGLTLLDIGGGIGVVQLELLGAGASKATSVEASSVYIEVARQEASRAGFAGRISYVHGDFTSLAHRISEADVVTLDRVICCYHDVASLVTLSSAKARTFYGVVYPRDTWWTKFALLFENLGYRLRGSPFRGFVHPTELVNRLIRNSGFRQIYHQNTFVWPMAWQVVLYKR